MLLFKITLYASQRAKIQGSIHKKIFFKCKYTMNEYISTTIKLIIITQLPNFSTVSVKRVCQYKKNQKCSIHKTLCL